MSEPNTRRQDAIITLTHLCKREGMRPRRALGVMLIEGFTLDEIVKAYEDMVGGGAPR